MKIQITDKQTKETRDITPMEYAELIHGFDGNELEMKEMLLSGEVLESETEIYTVTK